MKNKCKNKNEIHIQKQINPFLSNNKLKAGDKNKKHVVKNLNNFINYFIEENN
jgi:hypothetical protein